LAVICRIRLAFCVVPRRCASAGAGADGAAFAAEGQQPLGEQGDHRRDDHSGVDAGRVEGALGVRDEQAQALVGARVLAHDRADQGEAEGRVQRREDP
jgi:hypothetical protein